MTTEASATLIASELLRLGMGTEFTKEEAYAAVSGMVPPDNEADAKALALKVYRDIMWSQCQHALAIDQWLDVTGWANFFDRCTLALGEERRKDTKRRTPPALATKYCKDCRHGKKIDYGLRCLCPQQRNYGDKAGAEDFTTASIIREYQCHGRWWEPRP